MIIEYVLSFRDNAFHDKSAFIYSFLDHQILFQLNIIIAEALRFSYSVDFKKRQVSEEDLCLILYLILNFSVNDNGFALWETRAILTYLVDKYATDDSLYPKDVQKRAVVDQRLYFDLGTLQKAFGDHFYPIMRKEPQIPDSYKGFEKAFEFLEVFLEGKKFLAGDFLSVVDFMSGTSLYAFALLGCDLSKYTNLQRYVASLEDHLPGFDETKKNLEAFKNYFK